jgi:transposase InsO family protein
MVGHKVGLSTATKFCQTALAGALQTIEEAQDFATQWLWTYNNDRPNMGIGGVTPAQKLNAAA